jgi:hypothetical protein
MDTGITGGEGLVLKRPIERRRAPARAAKKSAKKAARRR